MFGGRVGGGGGREEKKKMAGKCRLPFVLGLLSFLARKSRQGWKELRASNCRCLFNCLHGAMRYPISISVLPILVLSLRLLSCHGFTIYPTVPVQLSHLKRVNKKGIASAAGCGMMITLERNFEDTVVWKRMDPMILVAPWISQILGSPAFLSP